MNKSSEIIKNSYILFKAQSYKTNNIMMTMGGDFEYENSREWFENLDRLMKYVNMVIINAVTLLLLHSEWLS